MIDQFARFLAGFGSFAHSIFILVPVGICIVPLLLANWWACPKVNVSLDQPLPSRFSDALPFLLCIPFMLAGVVLAIVGSIALDRARSVYGANVSFRDLVGAWTIAVVCVVVFLGLLRYIYGMLRD